MSGHSKWAGIKHQKAITDKRRGKIFTKLANNIAVAVKEGHSDDPSASPRLRDAIAAAKDANMPGENIKRAIERGAGKGGGESFEIIYEGYGPAGVAVMAEAITDNKNRTAGEIRSVFTKNNGKLGGPGSVSWMFESRGVIKLEKGDVDSTMLQVIDAGAQDVEEDATGVLAYTDPTKLSEVSAKCEELGLKPISKGIEMIPKQSVVVGDESEARAIIKFMEALEDQDDVAATYANFDITPEVTEKLTA